MNKKENKFWSDIKGLTHEEVENKIKNKENNVTVNNLNKSIKSIIFSNLFTLFNLLLVLIAVFVISQGRYEQLFFLFINSLNVSVNIFQEIKAKKTLDKVFLLSLNATKVIRDFSLLEIPIENVVTEDVLYLELGSQIIADSCVKKGTIEVDESFLTGESDFVLKKEGDFLYSGSYVVSGTACAVVIYVGENMYVSKLTKEAKKYKRIKTPLLESFSSLIKIIIYLLTILIPILILFMFKSIDNERTNFILGICGFILGIMPSGLFLLTSVSLFVGCIRLVKKNTYVKDLFGIEMLAQIDVLCLDKTGTITDGTMTVKNVLKYPDSNLVSNRLMFDIISAFPNNNSTQNALYQKFYFPFEDKLQKNKHNILKTQSFSSSRKYSGVEIENLGTFLLGAPEFILKKQFYKIKKDFQKQAQLGYRVLLLAQTDTALEDIKENTNYKIVSLIALEDTIKKDAFDVINFFIQNGIKIKIISGDNPDTVSFISKKLNIISDSRKVINLMGVPNKELNKIVMENDVFGRVSPEQKKILIQNLKKNNQKVAMIGDGVNDILAFKESDISIAMASGSESTKHVANLVLLDSQFSSLPQVVSEGRKIVNNLKKNAILFLTKNILFFSLVIINILYNSVYLLKGNKSSLLPFPLVPLQFNLFDSFFIGIPAFFLSLDKNNKKIEKSFFRNIAKRSLFYSLTMSFFYLLLLINCPTSNVSQYLAIFISLIFFILFVINCFPFNKFKIILIITMFLSFSVLYWIFNQSFLNNFI
ncbi:HAD-IC family P-type ATPase ['Camptotheca acuminata' phytoplasma]|uniref:HAD-IC family P-type ATPase n=1 Tax='Camptotheca acuminata' phytoplasma TaxID=3239192 RepID=UPI00351A9900